MDSFCRFVRESISAFIDDALSPADRDLIRLHLQDCPKCRYEHRAIVENDRRLGALAETPAPDHLWEKIQRQAERRPARVHRLGPVVAVAAGILGVVLAIFLQAPSRFEQSLPGGGRIRASEGSRVTQVGDACFQVESGTLEVASPAAHGVEIRTDRLKISVMDADSTTNRAEFTVVVEAGRQVVSVLRGVVKVIHALGRSIAMSGERIVFGPDASPVRDRTVRLACVRDGALWEMNIDGSNAHKIVDDAFSPDWSPDGRWIVYSALRDGNAEICVWDRKELTEGRLTTSAADDVSPRFSPDGKLIVFASRWNEDEEIWVMSLDGGEPKRLTQSQPQDYFPTFSPDGRKIVWVSGGDLWWMNADGSDQSQLTHTPEVEYSADFSPDGRTLVYSRLYSDRVELCLLDVASGFVRVLKSHPEALTGMEPRFRPGGGWIVATLYHQRRPRLHLFGLDGRESAVDPGPGEYPAWSPFLKEEIP